MLPERRIQMGIVVVTKRPRQVGVHCQAAGLPARVLSVQSGPAWPELRPPVLLDTIGLPVEELVALLARPPRLSAAPGDRAAERPFAPVMALADPADCCVLRLLGLCPAVELVCAESPQGLARWLAYLEQRVVARSRGGQTIWLIEPPADAPLEPALLSILAALLVSPSYSDVAAHCGLSDSTLYRTLRAIRTGLGLPTSTTGRLEPADLFRRIIERLADPQPLIARER